jgi:hypothetical protein
LKSNTVVELEGVNGEWFNLTTGDRGVYLATDVKGAFFDPPVKAVYEEPGNYAGSRYLNHRVLRRDITFGVEILNDAQSGPRSWLSRDSEWRKAWAFDKDCTLYVTTPDSGTRRLKLRLLESPDVDMKHDPNMMPLNRTVMTCVAGDPFWYQDDVIYTATTATNTTFDPNAFSWPWAPASLPSENLTITVNPSDGKGGLNPTDQYIFPKWTVPGSTFAPALPYVPGLDWLGAPQSRATIWTIPDYSFEDAEQADRRVRMPGLIGGLRTDEYQCFNLDGIVGGGNFKLTHNGQTTGNIPWNASAGVVKASLEALANIAYDDVEVTVGKATRETQILQIEGATGGTFTLSFAGSTTDPIPFNATDLQIWTALVALPSIGLFDISVKSKISNEAQTVTLVGEPTGGTFTLSFDGSTTDPIAWNASPLTVYNAVTGIGPIDWWDINVSQEWWKKYAPWTVTFARPLINLGLGLIPPGRYEGVDVPKLTGNADGLTGGAGMDVIVSTQAEGSRPYVITFGGTRNGQNVPDLIVNGAGLTRGDSSAPAPQATVYTDVPGSKPYIVRYRNNLSGTSFPLLGVDTSLLTGYGTISSRVWKTVEGYTAPAENCVIDADPRVEQVVSESGSTLWARMNGVRFRNPIPPYTESKTFTISVSGCVAGQLVSLRLPRPWSRPWGLE